MPAISPFDSSISFTRKPLTPLQVNTGKSRINKWAPAAFEEKPSYQEALNSISIRDPLRTSLVIRDEVKVSTSKTFIVSKERYSLLEDSVKLAESYTDLIEHHVATRVALFFQQAIICYRTPFHYEVGDTEGQIFDAKKLKVKTETGPELEIGYQAAHSSTIPSLKACLITDYQNAKRNGQEPKYSSFLEGSYMEILDNSTVGLPTFVNQIDTLIDGNSKSEDALRIDTIHLINELAVGKITPCEATRKFLACFLRQLKERPEASKTINLAKKKTISIYKEKVKEMIALAETPNDLKEENAFFDSLLSNNFSHANKKDLPILRKIFYKRKFEIIREAQFTETQIQKIINKYFPKTIKPADKHAIRACLTLQTAKGSTLNKTLEVLFSISISAMEKDAELCQKLQQEYESNSAKYTNALRDIRAAVRGFQRMEGSFQAMLLRDFRIELRGLTQKLLAEKIDYVVNEEIRKEKAKDNPNAQKIRELNNTPRSASTISRLENSRIHIQKDFKTGENQRRKELTFHQAALISKALNVDPEYYFCSFFASKSVARVSLLGL